jgi:hypothetical protein
MPSDMTSKEIIRRVIRHNNPPRIGWDMTDGIHRDIATIGMMRLIGNMPESLCTFGHYEDLKKKAGFHGEVRLDTFGNLYGRLNGKTQGECVLGALESGWEQLDQYAFPQIDMARVEEVKSWNLKQSPKYILSAMLFGVFSTLRDLRKMENALMDTAAEPEMIEAYMEKFVPFALRQVELCADCGADGIIIYDDWGMQFSPFISPASFRELFKPVYKQIADTCHERGMDLVLHSCGCVQPLMEDMLDAGIDVFQFDQPEAKGSRYWAKNYGHRAAFYCPTDIQKIMPTGDRALIEQTTVEMVEAFKACGGSLIFKDYPSWGDIDVREEWAQWARDAAQAHSKL